jgi:hypothetical protein
MKRVIFLLAMLSTLFIFSGLCLAQNIIDVVPDSPNIDCSNPPCNLRNALIFAGDNPGDDTIRLASGVYKNTFNVEFIYEPTTQGALTLIGQGEVVIDGHTQIVNGTPSLGAVGMLIDTTFANLIDDTGSNITLSNISFLDGLAQVTTNGGGLSITTSNANVNIQRCSFKQNFNFVTGQSAEGGGGLFVNIHGFGDLNLLNSSFSDNVSINPGGAAFLQTGFGDEAIIGNNFTNNIAFNSTGNSGGTGGAVATLVGVGTLTVNRNFFLSNLAGAGGGLAAEVTGGKEIITNNIFSDNEVIIGSNPPSITGGGGALVGTSFVGSAEIINNTFFGNKASNADAGGLEVLLNGDSATADIYNNIVRGNLATGSTCAKGCHDIFVDDDDDANKIGSPVNVFNNDYSDITFVCDPNNVAFKCSQNVDPTTNIDKDPMFVNAGSSDFRLLTGSLAIDAGSAAAPFLPEKDFALNPRNQGSAPDMGALESKPGENPQPGSENCSNNVDDDGNGLIDCNDPACSSAAVCTGEGGGGGVTPNAGNGGGCSMMATSGSSSSVFYLVAPLLLAVGALVRNLKSGRGE